jgi:hypothetical protein
MGTLDAGADEAPRGDRVAFVECPHRTEGKENCFGVWPSNPAEPAPHPVGQPAVSRLSDVALGRVALSWADQFD